MIRRKLLLKQLPSDDLLIVAVLFVFDYQFVLLVLDGIAAESVLS